MGRTLLIIVNGRVRLEGGRPQEASKVGDPCTTFLKLRQLGRTRALPTSWIFGEVTPTVLPRTLCSCRAQKDGLTAGAALSTGAAG
jgi:hypothetical protein